LILFAYAFLLAAFTIIFASFFTFSPRHAAYAAIYFVAADFRFSIYHADAAATPLMPPLIFDAYFRCLRRHDARCCHCRC